MAQPSQQSFIRQSYGTRQLCSIGYQIESFWLPISQTRTICISGSQPQQPQPVTGHCNLSLPSTQPVTNPSYP